MSYAICGACAARVVPRLWHVRRLGVVRVHHICPFCAGVLYVTGPPLLIALPVSLLHALLKIAMMVVEMGGTGRLRRY